MKRRKRKQGKGGSKQQSRMKGDQRMPIGKGEPMREEIRSSNLERQCYGREYKNGKTLRKRKLREDNEMSCN